jgi:hypothetical protein
MGSAGAADGSSDIFGPSMQPSVCSRLVSSVFVVWPGSLVILRMLSGSSFGLESFHIRESLVRFVYPALRRIFFFAWSAVIRLSLGDTLSSYRFLIYPVLLWLFRVLLCFLYWFFLEISPRHHRCQIFLWGGNFMHPVISSVTVSFVQNGWKVTSFIQTRYVKRRSRGTCPPSDEPSFGSRQKRSCRPFPEQFNEQWIWSLNVNPFQIWFAELICYGLNTM